MIKNIHASLASAMAAPLRRNLDYQGIARRIMVPPIITRIFMSDNIFIDTSAWGVEDTAPTYVITTDKFEISCPSNGSKLRVKKVIPVLTNSVCLNNSDGTEDKDELINLIKYATILVSENYNNDLLPLEITQDQALEMFTKRENGKIVYANAKDVNDKIENMLIVG